MKANLFNSLLAISAANPLGFTVNAETLAPVTSGYAVAVAGTQNSFGREGLARVIDYARKHEEINAFGGWMDSETGLYYFDAVVIYRDIEAANRAARLNGQIAFFDLSNLHEIRVK